MTAPASITLARPGYFKKTEIATSPPEMSWRTDGPGSLSCQTDTKELARRGYPPVGRIGLKGKWLWYEHPTAGGWGGVVTGTTVNGPITEIRAEDFAVLLRRRTVAANWRPFASSPGTIALQYLTSANRAGEQLGLTSWTAEEGADVIDFDPRAGDLCDEILPELADYGYQWQVLSRSQLERAFVFRRRVGRDKRATVLLTDRNINLDSLSIDGDLWTVANSIEGIAADSDFVKSAGYVLENRTSVKALGRRYEAQIAYDGVATRSTIAPLVKRDLARLSYPAEIVTLDVNDTDQVWREFREGDTITVALEYAGIRCPMTVDVRSLSVENQLVTISGELLVAET